MRFKRGITLLQIVVLLAVLVTALASVSVWAEGSGDTVRLHLMWTNDLHGHIAPEGARFMNPAFPPPLGGGASAANYIKEVRAKAKAAGEEVLLVDAGDMFQGTPIGTKTKGTAVIEYYNSIGYDLAVPGNHDFDLGRENCERIARLSNFPWLAANLVEEATGETVDWVQPTIMLDIQGLKLGVIGLITPGTKSMAFPDNIAGLDFLDMPETLAKYRDELKSQGADVIALLIHEGLPYDPEKGWKRITGSTETETNTEQQGTYGSNHGGSINLMELVNKVPGIDFAIGGHTHRGYHEPWIDPQNHTMCFESFGNGSSLGHAILIIDRKTGTLLGYEGSHDRGTLITLFEDEIWPDSETTDLIKPHVDKAEAEMLKVVGTSAIALPRGGPGASLMGNLITDAMREHFNADFSFQNVGGLRADLPAGDLTAKDIFGVLPFGNELVIVEMDGRMIRRIVERKVAGRSGGLFTSGAKVTFDKTRPDMDRVVELEVNGEPWDPDRIYKVICTNYLMEGNSGLHFLTSIPPASVEPSRITTAESVEAYMKKHSPIRPRIDDRWVEEIGKTQETYLQKQYLPETVE